MTTPFAHVTYTEKEGIADLTFPKEDVLKTQEGVEKRLQLIDQAIDAGNFAQFKVMILFEDNKEVKEVETTIWERDKNLVYLKNKVVIPIHRIHKIKFA
jgi:uncharacterized protein (UPF0248 family)